jgi:diguanylate cyclase (GGDEF)-like protein
VVFGMTDGALHRRPLVARLTLQGPVKEDVELVGADSGQTRWVVLLEAADENGLSTVDADSHARLVSSWGESVPTTLYSPNRYALQVIVDAGNAAMALGMALSQWKDALKRATMPEWELVRAEVLTSRELERELRAAEQCDMPDPMSTVATGSERVESDELLRRALHDDVTGLPTREAFVDEVRRELQAPISDRTVRVVVALALDQLARREPSAPPSTRLMTDVSERLTATVRRVDTVARIGEAEFAALVTLPSARDTQRLAERVVQSVRSVGDRHRRPLTASVGVATASSADDPDELLLAAELAMVAARDAGGDRYVHLVGRSERDSSG